MGIPPGHLDLWGGFVSCILVNCARHGHGSRFMYTACFRLLGSSVHHESELMLWVQGQGKNVWEQVKGLGLTQNSPTKLYRASPELDDFYAGDDHLPDPSE